MALSKIISLSVKFANNFIGERPLGIMGSWKDHMQEKPGYYLFPWTLDTKTPHKFILPKKHKEAIRPAIKPRRPLVLDHCTIFLSIGGLLRYTLF